MPRTIESILACHDVATARRQAGKRIWDLQLPLKPVLKAYEPFGDNLTAAQATQMCHQIGAVLLATVPQAWRDVKDSHYSMDFEDVFDWLTQATEGDFKDEEDTPCDVVNGYLDTLYDWADRNRVWIA